MASPAISPEAMSVPFSSARARPAASRFLAQRSAIQRMTPPRKMAELVSKGRYMPTAISMGRARAAKNQRDAEGRPGRQQSPRHLPAHDAAGKLRHEPRLRGGQRAAADAAGGQVGLVQRQDGQHQEQGQQHHRDDLHQLHLPRRAAQQVAGLEVLNQRTGKPSTRRPPPKRRPTPPPRPACPWRRWPASPARRSPARRA